MEKLKIAGGYPLKGEVRISGAKNSAVALIPATILAGSSVTIEGLPEISDVEMLKGLLEEIGGKVTLENNEMTVDPSQMVPMPLPNGRVKQLRASYYLMGAMLGKFKKAVIGLPGGCYLGPRPIDQHIKGFEALGATVKIEHGMIKAEAKELKGNHIYFDVSSVGATINIMFAACLAEGVTILENSAKEPHVVDVANFLNSMGANIKGAGTDVIRIKGVEQLNGSEYSIIPDQIEAGTFMLAAAATKGNVLIKNVIPKHLEAISAKLIEVGATIEEYDDAVRVSATKILGHTNVKTLPYPGFPTDMQPQMTAVLTTSEGTSIVTETIFESRFKYVDELSRMGANIKVEGNTAIIDGVKTLTGAIVSAPDLRAGAALVIAGLVAEGFTTVEQVEYIERGYENFERKMQNLGATMVKVDVENEKEIQKFKLRVG